MGHTVLGTISKKKKKVSLRKWCTRPENVRGCTLQTGGLREHVYGVWKNNLRGGWETQGGFGQTAPITMTLSRPGNS